MSFSGSMVTRSFSPYVAADQDLAVGKINVFDPQPEALNDAQTGTVQKTRDQPARSSHLREQALHLRSREHDRQPRRPRWPLHSVQPWQLAAEHVAVQEKDRRQCLVLRRGRHAPLARKMVEKRGDLGFAERLRVALAVEEDVAPDP